MSNLDQVWGATQAGEITEDSMPPVGLYVPQVYEAKADTSKKGEFYMAVGFRLDDGRQWSDVRVLTKNGVPQEGRIKAAKIMLRQLGINPDVPPSQLAAHLGTIVGRHYTVEIKDSGRVNTVTGQPLLNTDVQGPASAPTLNVAPQAPAGVSAPAPQVQVPHAQVAHFGSAAAAFPMPGEPGPAPVAVPVAEVQRSEAIQVPQAPAPVYAAPPAVAAVPGAPTFPAAVPGQAPTVVPQQVAADDAPPF